MYLGLVVLGVDLELLQSPHSARVADSCTHTWFVKTRFVSSEHTLSESTEPEIVTLLVFRPLVLQSINEYWCQ